MTGRLRTGWPRAVTALLLAVATVGVVVASSWSVSQTAGRLAIGGLILFGFALVLGSSGLVGATTVPMLSAALIASAGFDEPAWAMTAVVGVLWYLTAELAWDAIERRDGVRRSRAYGARRIDEATAVVVASLIVIGAIVLLADWSPVRTVFVVAVTMLGVAVGAGMLATRLRRDD